jgi:hypothetical protein
LPGDSAGVCSSDRSRDAERRRRRHDGDVQEHGEALGPLPDGPDALRFSVFLAAESAALCTERASTEFEVPKEQNEDDHVHRRADGSTVIRLV